jgi:SAM-dependent methyltransferase
MRESYKNKRELIAHVIGPDDTVLDIGFWGQGKSYGNKDWPHALIQERAKETWGIDLAYDESAVGNPARYRHASAESFDLPQAFDIIFAGDIIEHLPNPGLFLDSARRHLKPRGRLVLTTPNTFHLFNLTEKLTKREPTVNSDHTCYFNTKTIRQLLKKTGYSVHGFSYLYTLDSEYRQSLKKRLLNVLYRALSWRTTKFLETLVVVAVPDAASPE